MKTLRLKEFRQRCCYASRAEVTGCGVRTVFVSAIQSQCCEIKDATFYFLSKLFIISTPRSRVPLGTFTPQSPSIILREMDARSGSRVERPHFCLSVTPLTSHDAAGSGACAPRMMGSGWMTFPWGIFPPPLSPWGFNYPQGP